MTAIRQLPTANHDEKNYIILGFFSTKVEPLRLSPNNSVFFTRTKVEPLRLSPNNEWKPLYCSQMTDCESTK